MKTVIVDARKLKETTDSFKGTYTVNGTEFKAAGIETGWKMGDQICKLFGLEDTDEIGEYCASGMGGKHVEFTFDPATEEWKVKNIK